MRFGFFIPQGWRLDLVDIPTEEHWPVMSGLATYADDSAWDSLWVYDHFHTVPMPTDEATHEAWSLMSAYAATTSRIKLGQMCTAMSYRNPVYLAKVAATADIISGGRVQMGIGGGWYSHEWEAYGYDSPDGFPSAGVRLGRLNEGVQIMRDAWRDGRVTFHGKHYDVDGAIVAPKPLQDGGPPLWIAGGGEKVTLKIAAKYARYTNFSSEPDVFAHKSQVLADHCRDVGTDYDAIVRSANFNAVIAESEAEVEDRIARIRARLDRRRERAGGRQHAQHGEVTRLRHRHARTGRREVEADARSRLRVRDPQFPRGGLRPLGYRTVRAAGHSGGRLVACIGAGAAGIGAIPGGATGPAGCSQYSGGGGGPFNG